VHNLEVKAELLPRHNAMLPCNTNMYVVLFDIDSPDGGSALHITSFAQSRYRVACWDEPRLFRLWPLFSHCALAQEQVTHTQRLVSLPLTLFRQELPQREMFIPSVQRRPQLSSPFGPRNLPSPDSFIRFVRSYFYVFQFFSSHKLHVRPPESRPWPPPPATY
jgi:hypothetical protein